MTDLIDLLTRVDEFLDNYVDVDDGDDGRPVANRAMSLQTDVRAALDDFAAFQAKLRRVEEALRS